MPILLSLFFWLAPVTVVHAANGFLEALAAVPSDNATGPRVEAGLIVKDLQQYRQWVTRYRKSMQRSHAGNIHFSSAQLQKTWGFDPFAELDRFVALVAPLVGTTPAGIIVCTNADAPALQFFVKAQAGLDKRLAQVAAAKNAPWSVRLSDGTWTFSVGDQTFPAQFSEGWLRVGAVQLMPDSQKGEPLFSKEMESLLQQDDVVLFARGGGMLGRLLGSEKDPTAAGLLSSLRALAMTWKTDGDKTTTSRILVDAPVVADLQKVAEPQKDQSPLHRLWGSEVMTLVSLNLPTSLLAAGQLPMIDLLKKVSAESSTELLALYGRLTGRMSYADFGRPGDWGLALETNDAQSAASFVPTLQRELKKAFETAGFSGFDDYFHLSNQTPPRLQIRPDPDVAGFHIGSVGKTIVVLRQRSRFEQIMNTTQKGEVAGPVTPAVGSLLRRNSIATGYAVLGTDGAFFDLMTWVAAAVNIYWKKYGTEIFGNPALNALMQRLPLTVSTGAFASMVTYDVGVQLDVTNGIVVLNVVTSEI